MLYQLSGRRMWFVGLSSNSKITAVKRAQMVHVFSSVLQALPGASKDSQLDGLVGLLPEALGMKWRRVKGLVKSPRRLGRSYHIACRMTGA